MSLFPISPCPGMTISASGNFLITALTEFAHSEITASSVFPRPLD